MTKGQLTAPILAAACMVGTAAFSPLAAQGVTSGPAAGGTVAPSAAVQKHDRAARAHSGQSTGMPAAAGQQRRGGVSAGDPGVEAKPGTEGGSSPDAQGKSR